MILINGQWQGGGEISTLVGSKEIEKFYLSHIDTEQIKRICIDTHLPLEKKNGIIGYDVILNQSMSAKKLLMNDRPNTIFTIGGGCDADVASIAYLNEKYGGDITIFWFDAHGDLNSPKESKSGLFYGMPARMLINPEYEFKKVVQIPVKTENWVQVGGRDFDEMEFSFIQSKHISYFPVESTASNLIENFIKQRTRKLAYIHFDLDVLDPSEFSATPLPVGNGLTIDRVLELLNMIKCEMKLIGFGLFEYTKIGKKNEIIESIFKFVNDLM